MFNSKSNPETQTLTRQIQDGTSNIEEHNGGNWDQRTMEPNSNLSFPRVYGIEVLVTN